MDAPLIGPVDAPLLHVMSYNIRRPMPARSRNSPDRWSDRKWLLRRLLASERPTLLGVQEAMPEQLEFVRESLGSSYRWVGTGRNRDGSGEHCSIFYDSDKLRVDDWSQQALSATPAVAGSRSWGNIIPRTVAAAEVRDLATNVRLIVLNTHLDHLSSRSRSRAAEMLRRLAADAAPPAIVMGDANAATGSRPYRVLTGDDGLRDSWVAATQRLTEEFSTYSGYRPPRSGGRRIDWILVDPALVVSAATINAARYDGAAPSDHEPVQALLDLSAPVPFSADRA